MYSNKYDKVRGIWTGKTYIIHKRLGSGGVGEIYLVEDEAGRLLALKLSTDMISITKEYKFLCRFKQKSFIPDVFDLDDFTKQGETYHYFTMEYIQGRNLKRVLKGASLNFKTKLDMTCIIIDIIRQINELGFIYTDLKHENIMVDEKNRLIKLVDMGSIVELGSTVKEYTAMYDRLCWGKGMRIADASYQMFVIAILFMSLLLNRSLDPEKEQLEAAMKSLRKYRVPSKVVEVISDCIEGRITDCNSLYHEVRSAADSNGGNADRLKFALNILITVLSLIITATVFANR